MDRDAEGAVEGGLIAITAEGVVGWARDIDRPAAPVRVVVLANDEPVASGLANRFDHPIVRARVGAGVPAFVVRLARPPRAGFPLLLTLRDVRGNTLGPPLPIRTREQLLPAVGAPAPGDYDGAVDGLHAGSLIGWALDRRNPAEPVAVAVQDGSSLLAETVADRFRPDLLAAGKGDGKCGFAIALPATLLDGKAHSLRVAVGEARIELPNSPVVFGPGLASDILDELARLRSEVERLTGRVAELLSPTGELQREIVRTLAERVARAGGNPARHGGARA